MFAEYRNYGFTTIPIGANKAPLVRQWQKIGKQVKWEDRFPDAHVAIVCGELVTLVDVDNRDHIEEARSLFGPTPIESATPSGGRHLWYRANGESRRIRPIAGLEVDILGSGGYAIVPPSHGYRFLSGSLSDIPSLPTLAPLPQPPTIQVGERNTHLFTYGRSIGNGCASLDELTSALLARNADAMEVPLSPAEVAKVAGSVWKMVEEGRCYAPETSFVALTRENHNQLVRFPDAYALFMELKSLHGGLREEFILSDATKERWGWGFSRWNNARKKLEELGLLHIVHKGGRRKGDVRKARLPRLT